MKEFRLILLIIAVVLLNLLDLTAQIYPSSPSNWIFPNGNSEATKFQKNKSDLQELDSFRVKWTTSSISGDVQPLVGNIINNPKMFSNFKYAPNELVAVMAGRIIVVDAKGTTHKVNNHFNPFIKSVSCLIDTNATSLLNVSNNPMVLGLEMIEFENKFDSLAYSYLAGFDNANDTVKFIKRLAIDLRPYSPNIFGSVKPVFGKREGGDIMIYASLNMSNPDTTFPISPFLRGFTQFNLGQYVGNYPMPDAGDDINNRIVIGPETGFFQPSFTALYNGAKETILIPNSPQPNLSEMITNINPFFQTFANRPYLLGFDIASKIPSIDVGPLELNIVPEGNLKPIIKPYFINLTGTTLPDSNYILIAEEYNGIGDSQGKSKLHLYNAIGDPITLPDDAILPSYNGGMNHQWSIAIGNVDGNADNNWLPYYPNFPGNEIIVTQSTRDFVFPGNRITILRFFDGPEVEKPSPPGAVLYPFDTICSQRINGWVAAVNDIDGEADNKAEIFMVDGSVLRVLRLRNYQTGEFSKGTPFDTVFQIRFPQTISNVAIADLEGDGLNDMIVTTFDSTYVIGKPFMNTILSLAPESTNTQEYCIGDTVTIKWMNYMKSSGGINVDFQEYVGGFPSGAPLKIATNLKNQLDTNYFYYKTENKLAKKTGRFILSNTDNPIKINDTTSFIKVNIPSYTLTSSSFPPLYVGDEIFINGNTNCTDSAEIEINFGDSTWIKLWSQVISTDGSFALKGVIPCPTFFRCDSIDKDTLVFARVLSYKSTYTDTSNTYPFRLYPEKLKFGMDTNFTADPTKIFRWRANDLKENCDSLNILISLDNGVSFNLLNSVKVEEEKFTWLVPLNLPDEVLFRLCCNTCMRSDTLITNYKPTYIQIVAPNPFKPPYESLEVVYKVDSETNVTIRILDQTDRLVATPTKDAPRSPQIAYADHWDGLRWDGSPADSGMYYLVMDFSNGKREVYPVFVRK